VGCTFEFATYKHNILVVISTEIEMECELHGLINFNKKNANRLRLHGVSDAQFKFILSLIIARIGVTVVESS